MFPAAVDHDEVVKQMLVMPLKQAPQLVAQLV
jgi:hypothetical protein